MYNDSMTEIIENVKTDEELVADAIAARQKAETTEEEAAPSRWCEAEQYATLIERGWTGVRVARACKVDESHVSRFKNTFLRYRNPKTRPASFWQAYAEVTGEKSKLDPLMSSETPEWETPQHLFDILNDEFGFTLDVCATAENAKCERYFTKYDDGILQDWTGVCWMNPPYGKEIPVWVEKAWESAEEGATVVCLVPARTDTAWWWDYCIKAEIRFLRRRLKFGGAETGAPFPSAVVVFGREPVVRWWDVV